MPERQGATRWALAILLLLGACGGTSPDLVALPAPVPATAPESDELRPAEGDGVAAAPGNGAALETPTEREGLVASALASSPGDGEVDEMLADLKTEEPLPASGPPIVAPDRGAAAALVAARPPGTAVGYLLIDLESGQALAELNPDLPLIPASTAKLATAVVALDVLGPEHRYRTELLARGAIEAGVLHGDLILRGGGDPALDVADLLELVVRLENRGVRYVDGRFLVDDSALPRFSEIAPGQPPEAAYNPGIGALSLAFNRVRVAWRGGGRIDAATLPPLHEATFEGAPPGLLPPGGVQLERNDERAVIWRVADRGRRRQVTRAAGQGSRTARRLCLPPARRRPGHLARPAAARPHAGGGLRSRRPRERASALSRARHAGLQQQHDGRDDRAVGRGPARRRLGRPAARRAICCSAASPA